MDVPGSLHFKEAGLCPLQDEIVWNDVDSNGRFVPRYQNEMEVAEPGWDELIGFARGPRWVSEDTFISMRDRNHETMAIHQLHNQ